MDVICHDQEDASDAFYILSAFHMGTEMIQIGLTTPLRVYENEVIRFADHERALFSANVPYERAIQGGMVAFHASFTHDWRKRRAWIDAIHAYVVKAIMTDVIPVVSANGRRSVW